MCNYIYIHTVCTCLSLCMIFMTHSAAMAKSPKVGPCVVLAHEARS